MHATEKHSKLRIIIEVLLTPCRSDDLRVKDLPEMRVERDYVDDVQIPTMVTVRKDARRLGTSTSNSSARADDVFIGPILPHLTEIRPVISAIKNYVNSVWVETLNIKCGNWKDIEIVLCNHFPHLAAN